MTSFAGLESDAATDDYVASVLASFESTTANGIELCTSGGNHLFVARQRKEAVGLVVMSRHQSLWRTSWDESGRPNLDTLELVSRAANCWAADFVWTRREKRYQGIAASLIRTAAAHLGVAVQEIAFRGPFTPSGAGSLRRLCPTTVYITVAE